MQSERYRWFGGSGKVEFKNSEQFVMCQFLTLDGSRHLSYSLLTSKMFDRIAMFIIGIRHSVIDVIEKILILKVLLITCKDC